MSGGHIALLHNAMDEWRYRAVATHLYLYLGSC